MASNQNINDNKLTSKEDEEEFNDHVKDTGFNVISVLDIREEVVENANKILVPPADVLSKGKSDKKGPQVSYADRSIPQTKALVYLIPNVFMHLYDEQEAVEQAITDSAITRNDFLINVYKIVGIQLIVTFPILFIFDVIPAMIYLMESQIIMATCFFILQVVILILMAHIKFIRQESPFNIIATVIYTICSLISMIYLIAYHDIEQLLISFGITLITFVLIALISLTRCDFTGRRVLIKVLLGINIAFFLLCIILIKNGLQVLIGFLAPVFYIFLFIYSIQVFQLTLGHGKLATKTDEHFLTAGLIYLLITTTFRLIPIIWNIVIVV